MAKLLGKALVLLMVALAIGNAQCVSICAAGICNPQPDVPPCHQQHTQPAGHCAHPTPHVTMSPVWEVLAVAPAAVAPLLQARVEIVRYALAEFRPPPLLAPSSIDILRV